jgi:hypothetical protein
MPKGIKVQHILLKIGTFCAFSGTDYDGNRLPFRIKEWNKASYSKIKKKGGVETCRNFLKWNTIKRF